VVHLDEVNVHAEIWISLLQGMTEFFKRIYLSN